MSFSFRCRLQNPIDDGDLAPNILSRKEKRVHLMFNTPRNKIMELKTAHMLRVLTILGENLDSVSSTHGNHPELQLLGDPISLLPSV